MIRTIQIKNYKSIDKAQLKLGRINVLIGENGAGKSNILEAIALAAAAKADKLDNEFLSSRGIRVSRPEFMRSALKETESDAAISVNITDQNGIELSYEIWSDETPYQTWSYKVKQSGGTLDSKAFLRFLKTFISERDKEEGRQFINSVVSQLEIAKLDAETLPKRKHDQKLSIKLPIRLEIDESAVTSMLETANISMKDHRTFNDFMIYSPENTALRIFEREGQIQPLGINGEGLLKLLLVTSKQDPSTMDKIKKRLNLVGWFEDFTITEDNNTANMRIKDSFLEAGKLFDQRSANEGFLFLVFYFMLFSSKLTPSFFAIDNIDASLNPKLCKELMKNIFEMALENEKQVVMTTHNPAILDGMDLNDDEQRLFIVSRGIGGETKIRRFQKPSKADSYPSKMSDLFLSGALGGLPKNF